MVLTQNYIRLSLVLTLALVVNFAGLNDQKNHFSESIISNENYSKNSNQDNMIAPLPPCANGGLGGTVFIDFNFDGSDDGDGEDGIGNIEVRLYKSIGSGSASLLETVMTDPNGEYSFTDPGVTFGSGEYYRIEFGNIPDPYVLSTFGSSAYTTTQFASAATCNINLGIIEPELYCQSDANFAINCYVDGDNSGTQDVLISIGTDVTPQASENNDGSLLSHESVANQIGSTFGLAYQKQSGSLFASSYMKRFSGYGPGGPGAIYIIDNPDDNSTSGSVFVDLNTLFGSNVAGSDTHDFLTMTGGGDFIDEAAFNHVGRISFGDMDITTDGLHLWVVNLFDRSLYRIPLGTDPSNPTAPTMSGEVDVIPLADAMNPLPDLPVLGSNDEIIPFALKIRRNKMYVGLVTNGQDSGPLMGLIYSYDLDSPGFTKELEFSLNYARGCGFGSGATCYGPAAWNGWLNSNVYPSSPPVSGLGEEGYPQPMITDIEFDNEENMIIGIRDRWGDQGGFQAPQPNSPYTLRICDAFGDLLFAPFDGTDWSINMADFTDPSTASGTQEPVFGGDDYIAGGYFHEETALGGLAVHHGTHELIVGSMDPRSNAFSNGVDWFSLDDSGKSFEQAITVLTGGSSIFGKSYGLGEIELICDEVPIHVGNYAYMDLNENGIQDPGEAPMENLTVKLYHKPSDGSNAALVATTSTNSSGQYFFTNDQSGSETWEDSFESIEKDSSYFIVFCGDSYDAEDNILTSNGYLFDITSEDIGEGINPDMNDSDITEMNVPGVGDFPVIMFSAEETNYDFDAGFIPKPDVAVRLVLDPGYDVSTVSYGSPVKFTATVYNQSLLDLESVTLTDYIPAGFEFDNDNLGNDGWSVDGFGYANIDIDDLDAGTDKSVCIYLNLLPAANASDWTNVVEISAGMANGSAIEDCDSELDNNPTNNGGGLLNSDADDEIDGDGSSTEENGDAASDQDNADPATVPVLDLALDKKLVEDKPYAPGEKAVFNITVYNQGNVAAAEYQLTDYMRDGFSFSTLNNAGWGTSGGNLVYTSSAALEAGSQITIPLELTVVVPPNAMLTDWWNYAEISYADDDTNSNNTTPSDPDSMPDDMEGNDNNVEPDDSDDDVINQNGKQGGDEDDHDPAKVTVGYDLALRKTVAPEGPYKYGDTLTYTIELVNQGGLPVSNVAVSDYLPCGLVFSETGNGDWSHSNGIASTVISPVLSSTESTTRDLLVVVTKCDNPNPLNYYNVAEITDFKDDLGDDPTSDDIDSDPDDNPDDDEVVDDQIDDPLDEDDHDIENIEICDLALINKIVEIPSAPKVGDEVKYEVIVFNQGNGNVQSAHIDYYIPNGLKYKSKNDTSTPNWNGNDDKAEIASIITLAPGDSDTLCLYLEVDNVPTEEATSDSWTTFAEISAFEDGDGDLKMFDADSTPDDDPDNDSGGNPDDETDDEIDGDGTGDHEDNDEDSDPELDEDDSDAAIIYICDVATIIYTDEEGPIQYGDNVQYCVEVHNQGNGPITNIKLQNTFGDGLAFADTPVNDITGWDLEAPGDLDLVIEDVLGPGETTEVCVDMTIIPNFESDDFTWNQVIEVVSFEDPNDPGVSKGDVDSNPDDDPDNDSGGNPDDDTDDETDGDGSGDPDDNDEDTDPELDEDDNDPVNTKIFDLALKMEIDSMPPVLPVVPGDVMKFNIVVYNQGNTEATNVELTNFVMEDNLFLNVISKLDGWDEINSEVSKFNVAGPIFPGTSDTSCVYLEVVSGAMSDIITWSEISKTDQTEADCYDIDSNPNDINGDDVGGDVEDGSDNVITDDGNDYDNDGIADEDDHDPAMLDVQDLALIVWADQKEPVLVGDDVKFIIRVTNQGNIINKEIKIANYIPNGFELSENDTNGWAEEANQLVTKTLDGTLSMGQSTETCIVLTVKPGVNASDLINYAEIVESYDLQDKPLMTRDVDSSPDAIFNNDPGGEPSDLVDCDPFPYVIGDDNNTTGVGFNGEDEDDHDPAWVPVLDLASIIYTEHTQPIIPGDDIKFLVDTYNQGNMAADEIDLTIYIPDGFSLSTDDIFGWEINDDGQLENTLSDVLLPEDKKQTCLILTVNDDFTLLDLIPYVEISGVQDSLGNNRDDFDLDSDPDFSQGNDTGGLPDGDTDDELNGTGEQGNDEDDHDPVVPPILDLAIKKVNTDPAPKVVGDEVKFELIIYNQGSVVPGSFIIEDYIPDGLDYIDSALNDGWSVVGDNVQYNYTDVLDALSSDTICLYLKVNGNANPTNVVNMAEIAFVYDVAGMDISDRDIDSEADNSNDNDKGNDIYSEEDDKIDENGRSGGDEDDHDQAFVLLCQEMVCINDVNISLDENCEVDLTAAMFVLGDLFPNEFYEFHIKDYFGNKVPVTSFDLDDVGETYVLEVSAPICNNACWTNVTVEYKLPPQIDCPGDLTLSCGALDVMGLPPAVGHCAPFEVFLASEEREAYTCHDEFTHRVTRTYRAVDSFGNSSECTHTVYIERVALDEIYFPESLSIATGNAISCGDSIIEFDANGIPLPWPEDPMTGSGSGVPILCDPLITNGLICPLTGSGTGVPLIPGETEQLCSAVVLYTDIELPEIGCVKKIMRTWEVREWWCNGENSVGGLQLIEIVDDVPPVIECPNDFTVTTNDSCAGSVSLPGITTYDECGHDVSVAIDYPYGFFQGNGGEVELKLGVNDITYIASDACYNQSECDVRVTVRDDTEPVAICERYTVVSISQSGNTVLTAESLDDGTWDECGLDRVEVARMDTSCFAIDTIFDESITLCCEDVGKDLMVVFQAVDVSGNTNRCMVNVEVQDKTIPFMTCPDDVTIDCREPYDLNNLSVSFGEPTIVDNCAQTQEIIEIVAEDVNQCGIGDIIRTFEIRDDNGFVVQKCKQHVYIQNEIPFVASNIQWPLNYDVIGGCGLDDLLPQNLPDLYNFPVFLAGDDECSLLGYDYEDKVFESIPGSGECAHIERTWTVINWCSQSSTGIFDQFVIPTPQIIKLLNVQAPEITSTEDLLIESPNIECLSGDIEVIGTADDDCENALFWNYEMKDEGGNVVSAGATDTIRGVFNVGHYTIEWSVSDGCGNFDDAVQNLEIRNTKAPSPICIAGLSASLVAWDTDGDGDFDTEKVELFADYFDGGSYHTCNNPIVLSLNSDTSITSIVYDCDSLGLNAIQLYVTDVVTGAQDYCVTYILIQDTNDEDICTDNGNMVAVEGDVFTEMDDYVEGVVVDLGNPDVSDMTDEEGHYAFADMPMGGAYNVRPQKDVDYLNGISTLDLILIQRHILGVERLNSPYKMIAADVDRSNSITAVDLVELRKLILGVYEELPSNTSWRFVDAGYSFIDPYNPWLEVFPEQYAIDKLESDMEIDFIGVKIGDVNSSVIANAQTNSTELRSNTPLTMHVEPIQLQLGELSRIKITANNYEQITGWQGTIEFDNASIEVVGVESGMLELSTDENVFIKDNENWLTISYNNKEGQTFTEDDVLFELVVRVKKSSSTTELFEWTSGVTNAEAYRGTDRLMLIDFENLQPQTSRIVAVSPNPWVETTNIEFFLPETGTAEWQFYDVNGRLLFKQTGSFTQGMNTYIIDRTKINGSGIIYAKMISDNGIDEVKMMLID